MSSSGREASRMSGTGREPSQMSGIGPEVLLYVQEWSGGPLDVREWSRVPPGCP